MRQLTCTAPNTLDWLDVEAPALQHDGDAIVRPLAVARCEIDPVLTSGLFPMQRPFAVGHEAVAEIVALGDAVSGFEIGQRVVVAFQVSCGDCTTCARGHSGNCDSYPVLSDYGMQPLSGVEYGGMLSDRVRVPHASFMMQAVPTHCRSVDLASLADNVIDGYRTVAPHLRERPGADVLIVSHGLRSISLYAVQTAVALGAGRVDFACDDPATRTLAEKLGARPIETDFGRRLGRYPIVADCGRRPEGIRFSIESTEPEGVCHSATYLPAPEVPIPVGKLYTLGIRFEIGRAHSLSLLPEVLSLVADGQLSPGEVTSRIVEWEAAPEAWLEDSVKLVVAREPELGNSAA